MATKSTKAAPALPKLTDNQRLRIVQKQLVVMGTQRQLETVQNQFKAAATQYAAAEQSLREVLRTVLEKELKLKDESIQLNLDTLEFEKRAIQQPAK